MRKSTEFTGGDSGHGLIADFLLESINIKDKNLRRLLLKHAVEHDSGRSLRAIHDAAVFAITSEIWAKFVLPLAMRSSVKDEIKLSLLLQTKSVDTLKLMEAIQTTEISIGEMKKALNDLMEVGNDIFAATTNFVLSDSSAIYVFAISLYIQEHVNELIKKTDLVADYINKGNQLTEEERGEISELFYKMSELKTFAFKNGKEDVVCQVIQKILDRYKEARDLETQQKEAESLQKVLDQYWVTRESLETVEKFVREHSYMDARDIDAEEPLAAALDFAQKQRYNDIMDARDIDALRAKESLAAALDAALKEEPPKVLPDGWVCRSQAKDSLAAALKESPKPKVLPDGWVCRSQAKDSLAAALDFAQKQRDNGIVDESCL